MGQQAAHDARVSMKPHIRRLPKTGDSEKFMVDDKLFVISGCELAVTRRSPLQLLADKILTAKQPV